MVDEERYQTTSSEDESTGENGAAADMEGYTDLEKQLQECQAKSNEYLDGWQRSRADFANYKRRMEREQAQAYQNAVGNIVKRYLDVLDDLELALKNRPLEGEGAAWGEGVELIARKLASLLESEGVKPMDTDGKEFDPNLHEALTNEESDQHESGQIIGVVKQGYLLGDRVIRPALVRVAK